MSGRDGGGPAFPQHVAPAYRQEPEIWGMSLRDYFAAKAMQAFAQSIRPYGERVNRSTEKTVAEAAYQFADAMLAAREESK